MKRIELRKGISYAPEALLAASLIFYFIGEWVYTASVSIFALACICILLTLVVWKNRLMALAIAIVLGIAGIGSLLAVLSEFYEFPAGQGLPLLLTGGLLSLALIAIAVLLPGKYLGR